MSTLKRDDGAEFVMQAYRELVSADKKTVVGQRVRLLAEQHGQFVRLFKKNYSEYEAAFSREPGYLLGESIKHYFGHIENLIFCEALPNSNDVLLVVIRSNNVYLDTMIASKNIRAELTPLLTELQTYQVIISGAVPIQQKEPLKTKAANEIFYLPSDSVHSFESLDAPLFPRLPLVRSLQLLPLPLALKAERLTNHQTLSLTLIFLGAALLLGLGFWVLTPTKTIPPQPITSSADALYQPYITALTTPSPTGQLEEVYNLITRLYGLPGWQAVRINFSAGQYRITVTSLGADFAALTDWAQHYQFGFQLTSNAALLTLTSSKPPRPRPQDIYPAQLIVTTLIDQLDNALHEKNITLSQSTIHGNITEMPLTINLTDASPQTLLLISAQLRQLPLSLTSMELNLKPGIINGTINISAWGK